MSKLMMTKSGYDDLMEKINNLSDSLREVNEAVSEGIEARDFREDSSFSVAVEERSKIQMKIQELEEVVNNCAIITVDRKTDCVDLGKSAKLLNVDTGEEKIFTLVGVYESNPKVGKISYLSPLGKSLIGSRKGDEFEVLTPTKEVYWEVLDIFIH